MITATVIIVVGFLLFIVLNIVIGMFLIYFNRKCPYCGKRMKYQYKRMNLDGSVDAYIFHCPHCGAFENVAPPEMVKEPLP